MAYVSELKMIFFTFHSHSDGVMHGAWPVNGGAAIFSSVRLRDVSYPQGLMVVQKGGTRAWNITAVFIP